MNLKYASVTDAKRYFVAGDYYDAVSIYKKFAAAGDDEAQYG